MTFCFTTWPRPQLQMFTFQTPALQRQETKQLMSTEDVRLWLRAPLLILDLQENQKASRASRKLRLCSPVQLLCSQYELNIITRLRTISTIHLRVHRSKVRELEVSGGDRVSFPEMLGALQPCLIPG